MTTPGDPFAEAAGEAVQTSVMAIRLITMIAHGVRRAAQKREAGEEQQTLPADQAMSQMAEAFTSALPTDIATALMCQADWPQMAQQLAALQQAGVDMAVFLPKMAGIAVTVRDAVAANAGRVAREGSEEWASLLREMMPAGPVREAILSSPAWPEIAAQMGQLQRRGVDVRQILVAAHAEGVGVDQAVTRVMAAGATPVPLGEDAKRSYGPLTVGLDVPKNLDLSNRERALAQLGVSRTNNERYTRWVHEAMPGREREAGLLLAAREWPLIAARMAKVEDAGKPVREHLARLMRDTSWEKGPTSQLGKRLVEAANEALNRPLGEAASSSGSAVSAEAARGRSVTATGSTAAKSAAPTDPATAPHRAAGRGQSPGRKR